MRSEGEEGIELKVTKRGRRVAGKNIKGDIVEGRKVICEAERL